MEQRGNVSNIQKENFIEMATMVFMYLDSSFKEERKRLFHSAVKGEWNKVLQSCTEAKWPLCIRITKSLDSLFHLAANNKRVDIFEKLLQTLSPLPQSERSRYAMMGLEMANKKGNNALHIAASIGNAKLCERIIRCTESKLLSVCNNEGEAPLFLAAVNGHKDAFIRINKYYCQKEDGHPDCKRNDGETILHVAISQEYYGEHFHA